MKKIEDRFKKLEPREHVLQRPDTYIGSIHTELKKIFVVDNIDDFDNIKIINKITSYNAGFYKIVDEIITNASDHYLRCGVVKYIKVNISNDHIIIENDGPGVPVEIHKEHKCYVPELIFGNMLAGENFDDSEQRYGGGRNGIGSKATNIFSKKFIVETADGKKNYYQEFQNNLTIINKPIITNSKKNYTKITFYPDFERFGLSEITEDIKKFILKRVLDIAMYCIKAKVYFNDELIKMNSFEDYMKLYINSGTETFYDRSTDTWEIGVSQSMDDNFQQVSMVNGVNTLLGGTHVNYISTQIINVIKESLEKKYKKITIKVNDIKSKLFLFVSCKLPNPTFDTQTKETLTSKIQPTEYIVSEKFIKQILASPIVEDIMSYIELREKAELAKLNKGKTSKVKVKKLDDANRAGTAESDKCAIFLAEGDSAAGTVLTGFASTGRDYFGCFPLKGKPLNVRKETIAKIKDNDEIKHIITALGLEFGKKYTSTRELRYGKLVIMSDADCIDETTKVRTKRGDIPLFDVTYDDEVLTHSGEYKFILNIISHTKKEYVEFELNGTILKFGLYHKLIIFRNGEVIEIVAKDLKQTDFLLIEKQKNMASII